MAVSNDVIYRFVFAFNLYNNKTCLLGQLGIAEWANANGNMHFTRISARKQCCVVCLGSFLRYFTKFSSDAFRAQIQALYYILCIRNKKFNY